MWNPKSKNQVTKDRQRKVQGEKTKWNTEDKPENNEKKFWITRNTQGSGEVTVTTTGGLFNQKTISLA